MIIKYNIFSNLTNSADKDLNFAKDVLLTTIGSAFAQILAPISSPIIAGLCDLFLALGTSALLLRECGGHKSTNLHVGDEVNLRTSFS